jgi:hypothetical protein
MSVETLVDQLAEQLEGDPAARRRTVSEAIRFLVGKGAVRESLNP